MGPSVDLQQFFAPVSQLYTSDVMCWLEGQESHQEIQLRANDLEKQLSEAGKLCVFGIRTSKYSSQSSQYWLKNYLLDPCRACEANERIIEQHGLNRLRFHMSIDALRTFQNAKAGASAKLR